MIEADCEYDVWGSGYFGLCSVTGGPRQNDEVWEGCLFISADQNVEKDNATSQQCGFHDNLQSTITT